MRDSGDVVFFASVGIGAVCDDQMFAGLSVIGFPQPAKMVQIYIVWVLDTMWMYVLAEDFVVIKSGCQQFGCWEQVGMDCWTMGHCEAMMLSEKVAVVDEAYTLWSVRPTQLPSRGS